MIKFLFAGLDKKSGVINRFTLFAFTFGFIINVQSQNNKPGNGQIHLITLDPGHYHAALVQKSMVKGIDTTVNVYAPDGPDVKAHLALVEKYNTRSESPTAWKEKLYTGPDYLQKMLQEKSGGIVVISGNNQKKGEYIKKSIDAGYHVLADKPMAITTKDFELLKEAFATAQKKKVLLYDIMTSRYEITNIIQKELAQMPELFGKLELGTEAEPAVTIVRTHSFLKYVSGAPLTRPVWYFDVNQEGDGIVDVTTHLVDLIQWECFPQTIFDYKRDINMLAAKRWPTKITPAQFTAITNSPAYPEFLKKDIKDNILSVYANGEMNYTIKGVHAKITMIWDVQAPDGAGDTHYCSLHGSKANLVIRQGKEQQYKPVLYIEPSPDSKKAEMEQALAGSLQKISATYPGITSKKTDKGWEIIIPEKFNILHEQNFAMVTEKFLDYLKTGRLPDWEVSAMITKYYTTTQALEKALKN